MEQPYTPGPAYGGLPPMGPPPKNWLVESILVTIFCCLPFGIVAIIKAAEVNSKVAAGDYTGAQQSSLDAAKWTKIGFFSSLGIMVIYVVLMMMGVGAAMMQGVLNAR